MVNSKIKASGEEYRIDIQSNPLLPEDFLLKATDNISYKKFFLDLKNTFKQSCLHVSS